MADFTLNLSGTAEVDDSAVETMSQQIQIAAHESQTLEPFVTHAQYVDGKSQGLRRYGLISINESPLNEREDVTSSAMSDSIVRLVPKEYGNVVTPTALASLQSGGAVDLAAAQVTGINMGQSQTRHAMLKLDASSNKLIAGSGTVGAITASDVLSGTIANKAYNKLARTNIPVLMNTGGMYVAIAHEDVLNDIRQESGFTDVAKYARPDEILRNEIGMYKGFRWLRNNLCTLSADAGDTNVDVYNTYFLGFNGLGKDTSLAPQMRITGPFDKFARFVNVGWYGVYEYGIIDPAAIWVAQTAASVGDNA